MLGKYTKHLNPKNPDQQEYSMESIHGTNTRNKLDSLRQLIINGSASRVYMLLFSVVTLTTNLSK